MSPFLRTSWLKIRRKKISLKILIAREWEFTSTFKCLLLNISFHISIPRFFKVSLTLFFSSTFFYSFHVFENFSSTSFLFFDLNWANWRLPPSFLTKIIIIKLYEEYYMEKFLWTNKLIFIYSIFRSNNISQNFVLLTLHGKFIFNRCMYYENYLCTR